MKRLRWPDTTAGAKAQPKRHNEQHEYGEQVALMKWLDLQYVTVKRPDGRRIEVCVRDFTVASMNGAQLAGGARHWLQAASAGAQKNYPDVSIDIPSQDYHGMRIEMKRRRDQFRVPSEIKRAVRPGQEACLKTLANMGYFTCAAFGWVEAAIRVCEYFEWDPRSKGLV